MLAYNLYQNQEKVDKLITEYTLSNEEINKLEPMKRNRELFINKNYQLLNITTTIVHLMKNNPDITDNLLFSRIKQLKPYLTDETIILGINKAKKLLFKPEYFTNELRKEIKIWGIIDD